MSHETVKPSEDAKNDHEAIKALVNHLSLIALEGAFDIRFVFNRWTLGDRFCTETLRIPAARLEAPDFDMLSALGFSPAEIACRGTGKLLVNETALDLTRYS